MITVFGLKNCDTCRKARKWLDEKGTEHRFIDVRADGMVADALAAWANSLGWETLLNRRGTTWRGLPDADKQDINETKALALMKLHPALIKRPIFDINGRYAIGFDDAVRTLLENGTSS